MKGRKRRMNGLQKEIENRHLPELMRLENGDAVTNCADWKLRREEIKKLLCNEYMGVTPENIKSAFECVGEDEDAYGGKAIEKTIKVQLANNNDAYEFIYTLYDEGNISFFLRSGTHFLGRDDWHEVMKYREEKTI